MNSQSGTGLFVVGVGAGFCPALGLRLTHSASQREIQFCGFASSTGVRLIYIRLIGGFGIHTGKRLQCVAVLFDFRIYPFAKRYQYLCFFA